MAANEKQKKFFDFLQKSEQSNKLFTIKDVVKATGWQESTFKSYFAKGQLADFVSIAEKNKYEASNSIDITFKQFEKKLSQSKHVQSLGHNCKSKLAKALLRKSKDNMMLALELYNRPSLENKIDGFVMMFCTAWEQLLKAKLIEKNGEKSIYRKVNNKGIKETISLRDCLDLVFPKDNFVKENITRIADLRDHAVHLLMPEVQGIASRLFQSGVFNYSSQFEEFCEIPFINTDNTGMISLVGDFKTPPLSMLKSIYGEAAEDILSLAKNLTKKVEDTDDISFAIPLDVTLQFAKKDAQGTQIVLTKAENGMTGLQEALVIEKTVDAERTHPYKQNQAIIELNNKLQEKYDNEFLLKCLPFAKGGKAIINANCFQSVVYKSKWKNANNEYHHYLKTSDTHLYSDSAISAIIKKVTADKTYLVNAKTAYAKRKIK